VACWWFGPGSLGALGPPLAVAGGSDPSTPSNRASPSLARSSARTRLRARTRARPTSFARSPVGGLGPGSFVLRSDLNPRSARSFVPLARSREPRPARAFSDPSFHWLPKDSAPSYPSREPPEGPIARGFQRTRLLRTPRSLCSLARAFSDPSTVFSPQIVGDP
jgi:hypothetical protein